MRADGRRRSPKKVQIETFEEVSEEVARGGSQRSSREVLNKEVVQGGPQEIAKGDVADGLRGDCQRRS